MGRWVMKERPPKLVKINSHCVFDLENCIGYKVDINPKTKRAEFTQWYNVLSKIVDGKEVMYLEYYKKVPLGVIRKSLTLMRHRKRLL